VKPDQDIQTERFFRPFQTGAGHKLQHDQHECHQADIASCFQYDGIAGTGKSRQYGGRDYNKDKQSNTTQGSPHIIHSCKLLENETGFISDG
jgi:hypothetical protein